MSNNQFKISIDDFFVDVMNIDEELNELLKKEKSFNELSFNKKKEIFTRAVISHINKNYSATFAEENVEVKRIFKERLPLLLKEEEKYTLCKSEYIDGFAKIRPNKLLITIVK